MVLMDPNTLTIDNFAGKPLVGDASSFAVKALMKSIKEAGQLEPVIISEDGVVYVGRRRVLACIALKCQVKAVRLSKADAKKALNEDLVRRKWSVADTARFVVHLCKSKKLNQAGVADYVRDNFGWTTGFGESYVSRYKKFAENLDKNEAAFAACDSLNEAMTLLEESKAKKKEKLNYGTDSTQLKKSLSSLESSLAKANKSDEVVKSVKEKIAEIRSLLEIPSK